ncbi:MAG: hypothetical protein ACXVNM_15225 [Bacteroidia bacterium]
MIWVFTGLFVGYGPGKRPTPRAHLQTAATTLRKDLRQMNVAMKASKEVSEPKSALTYEKLKTYKGFENISEAESEEMITGIRKLAKILFYLYQHEQQQKQNNDHENRT